MEYCLYNNTPAIVEVSDDGRRMIRLPLEMVVLPEKQVFDRWRRARHNTHMTLQEFFACYGKEYVATLIPYDTAVELGKATELPAGYWQKHIHPSWWAHRPVKTGFPPAVRS